MEVDGFQLTSLTPQTRSAKLYQEDRLKGND